YNRGVVAAMWTAEAMRTAMKMHNKTELKGSDVRDGFEALDVDENRLKELGLEGFTIPVKISCANHEGPGKVAVQQWDGKEWKIVSKGYYEPDRDVVDKLIKEDSEQFAKDNNITPRDCKSS
ncbi:MAG: ABC transporter permease, partial [Rhodoplanes sp.]